MSAAATKQTVDGTDSLRQELDEFKLVIERKYQADNAKYQADIKTMKIHLEKLSRQMTEQKTLIVDLKTTNTEQKQDNVCLKADNAQLKQQMKKSCTCAIHNDTQGRSYNLLS